MTIQEKRAAIIYINKVIASNNPTAAVAALKNNGYKSQFDILPAYQIENALLELYTANPSLYFQSIRAIPYREDITNWTTSPDTKQRIRTIANQLGISVPTGKIDFQGIWNSIIGTIGGTSTTTPGEDIQTSEPAIKATTLIILVVMIIVAVVVTYLFMFKKAS